MERIGRERCKWFLFIFVDLNRFGMHKPYIFSFAILTSLYSHKRTNNVMERYNRDFNYLFDSPSPGLFVFCEKVREEAVR